MSKLLKILLLFFTLLLLFNNSAKKDSTIKIAVPNTISSIPFLEINNLKINDQLVKVDFFQDHIMTMAEFIDGKVDLFVTGFTQGTANYSANKNIQLAATPIWGVSSLITADESIKSLNDLAGKTILVPFKKSPLELQLKIILKKSGFENKIKIDYAVPQQAVPMLLSGKADAISVPEPLVSKLVLAKKAFIVFGFADKWSELFEGEKRSPQVSIFVKSDFAKNNKELLVEIINSLKVKIDEINKNPLAFSTKYASTFELNDKIMESAIKNTLFNIPDFNLAKKISTDFLQEIKLEENINNDFFFQY